MGVAFITGFQGDNAQDGLAADKVYCMTKHFAGYSVPANGINISPSLIGDREMLTLHLLPFEAAITEAHVMAVMPSYNSVDSVPSHANHWLLTDILRNAWGFRGYVYSDWDGIDFLTGHRVARTNAEAGRKALAAGVDVEAPELDCFKTRAACKISGRFIRCQAQRWGPRRDREGVAHSRTHRHQPKARQ
jgi:beta-glucosidase